MRPLMAYNDQTRQFADFLLGTSGDVATTRRQRTESWLGLHGAMTLMPVWARKVTGTFHSSFSERILFRPNEILKSRIVRWVVGELPCKTIALTRFAADEVSTVSDAPAPAPTADRHYA